MIEEVNVSSLFIDVNRNKLPSISETNSFFLTPQAKRIMASVSGIFTMLNFLLIVGVTKRFRAKQTLKGEVVVALMISTFSSVIALGYFLFRVRKDMFLVRSDEIPNPATFREKLMEEISSKNMKLTQIKKELFASKVLDPQDEFFQKQVSDFVCGHLTCYLENVWKDVPQEELEFKNFIEGCVYWKETLEKVEELCKIYPGICELDRCEKVIDANKKIIETNSIDIERLKSEFETFKKEALILEKGYKLQVNQQKELKIELINVHKQKIRNIIDRMAIFNEAILMAYDDRDTLPEVCLEEDLETCLENVKTLLKEKEKLMHICLKKLQMNLSSALIQTKDLSKRLSEIDVEFKSHIEEREFLHKRFEETKQLEGVQESCEKLENELNELDGMITRSKIEQQKVLSQLNSIWSNSEIPKAREMIEIANFEFKNFEQILKNNEKIEEQLKAGSLALGKKMLQLEEDLKACNTSIDKSRKDQQELLSKMSVCQKALEKICSIDVIDHKRKNYLEAQKSNLLKECGLESAITVEEFLEEASQYIRTIDSRAINEEEIEVS